MKKFETPELEVQIFNTEDIMTESNPDLNPGGNPGGDEWDTPGAGFGG